MTNRFVKKKINSNCSVWRSKICDQIENDEIYTAIRGKRKTEAWQRHLYYEASRIAMKDEKKSLENGNAWMSCNALVSKWMFWWNVHMLVGLFVCLLFTLLHFIDAIKRKCIDALSKIVKTRYLFVYIFVCASH